MNSRYGLAATAVASLYMGAALAAQFTVGDRVTVGSTGDQGIVIEVGQQMTDGGTMIKVHLDKLPAGFPNVGSWYDSAMSKVTVTGHGAAPAANAPAATAPATNRPAATPNHPATTPVQTPPANGNSAPPGKVAVSAQSCQQAIRANYPPEGADQTITVNFLNFSMSGSQPYQATYANDWNGQGHTVQASPVHAKFTVLTHYADPNADDALRTYDANYMCYKTATTGEVVVEMTSRVPGGETATTIKKH